MTPEERIDFATQVRESVCQTCGRSLAIHWPIGPLGCDHPFKPDQRTPEKAAVSKPS